MKHKYRINQIISGGDLHDKYGLFKGGRVVVRRESDSSNIGIMYIDTYIIATQAPSGNMITLKDHSAADMGINYGMYIDKCNVRPISNQTVLECESDDMAIELFKEFISDKL